MASRTSYSLDMAGFDPAPTPFTEGVNSSSKVTQRNLPEGDGDNQVRAIFLREAQIAASATEDIDLQVDLDRYGVALAAVDVVAITLQNTGADPGSIRMEPAAADGWTALLDATGSTDTPFIGPLKPGTHFSAGGFISGDYPVSGSDKVITLRETGGADPVTYRLQIWVRR